MESKGYNKEEAEAQWSEFQEKIKQLRSKIQHARDDIKVDIMGDLEKMENHEAEIRNKMIKLNEGKEKWEDIESSIGNALYELRSTYEKTNSKHDL